MLRLALAQTRSRRRVAGAASAAGVVAGGLAWYRWQHAERSKDTGDANQSPGSLADASLEVHDTNIEAAAGDGIPANATQAEDPTARFIIPYTPSSRLLDNRSDVLRLDETSMIVDDPSVGFSRSDNSYFLTQPSHVESLNTFTRFTHAQRSCSFFSMFEGYNGNRAAQFARRYLVDNLINSLNVLYDKYIPYSPEHVDNGADNGTSVPGSPPPEEVNQVVGDAFARLDEDLVYYPLQGFFENPSKRAAASTFEAARAGSSACITFYESDTRTLRVASVGNSKAVLGRKAGRRGAHARRGRTEDLYQAQALTATTDITNPEEMERLQTTSPYSAAELQRIFARKRPTRSFGDAALKWSLDVQKRMHDEYLGDAPHPHLLASHPSLTSSYLPRSSPLVTAQPIINSIQIQPGDFLIVASEPIWGALTDQEAVGLVGWWVNDRYPRYGPPKVGMGSTSPSYLSSRKGTSEPPSEEDYESPGSTLWNRFQLPKDGYEWNIRKTEELPVVNAPPLDIRQYDTARPHEYQHHTSDEPHEHHLHEDVDNPSHIPPSSSTSPSIPSAVLPSSFPSSSPSLPITTTGSPSKSLPKWTQWNWHPSNRTFINTDPNAATHLARNALGGADEDLRAALLGMSDTLAKQYRGDLVVSVIFFNDFED